ncbi:lactosylceramide 1,3-N-acetyl-beta-D-glucosaminyltransferase A-like isoform X2 [Macrobrachium rosenbergii]|uniref:lactosylceramide 1,3-N-acetyl-beta-D-glucosaminyltransferase A-like isoform X2 n=1 Tax=Macrobrachium rosenbergii TaxID=79674 RepID=UPI0034D783B1
MPTSLGIYYVHHGGADEAVANKLGFPNTFESHTANGRPFHELHASVPTNFTKEEEAFCRHHPDIEVITYVHSVISHSEKRMNTRRTWARIDTCGKGVKLGAVFAVGRSKTKEEEEIVRKESELYHDIVQGDYPDDYHLLSYKGLSSLYWINKNCPSVPWTLHADDDIVVDVFVLKNMIDTIISNAEDKFTCRCLNGPVRRTGKWAVPLQQFSQAQYPKYCKGTLWLLPTRKLHDLLLASRSANYLWVDDAYLTGILAKEAGIGHRDFNEQFGEAEFQEEQVGRNISWYHLPEDGRMDLWQRILEHNNCSSDLVTVMPVQMR